MFLPPECAPTNDERIEELRALVRGRRVAVLTGAGCSTESGIPDYRSPRQEGRVRRPIQHQEFVRSPKIRARYWARSLLGWPRFSRFQPNPGHQALAQWEASGALTGLITQNVDRLHHRAGSEDVIELHGALERVRCLDCREITHRDEFQEKLSELNPGFTEAFITELRPDGDAELPSEIEETFLVPGCARCGGVLKPDVVFFGDNVAAPIVEDAFARVDESEVLLVVGSSLTVYSGYRFALRAQSQGKPIAVVNVGPTRADEIASLRIHGLSAEVLPRVVARNA